MNQGLDLSALTLAIKEIAGDNLDQIILTSDTDVAVLLHGFDPENIVDIEVSQHVYTRILALKGNEAFGTLASKLTFHIDGEVEAESLSGGMVLWSRG